MRLSIPVFINIFVKIGWYIFSLDNFFDDEHMKQISLFSVKGNRRFWRFNLGRHNSSC